MMETRGGVVYIYRVMMPGLGHIAQQGPGGGRAMMDSRRTGARLRFSLTPWRWVDGNKRR
jgi:hypothetical protein